MDHKCDVIVLTWNQKEIIKSFVESFLNNTDTLCRLIIIDNASTDDTPEYLQSLRDTELCKFKIVLNKENRGFVRGMNQGIEISDAPYVCLANNDLFFTKGWLKEIIDVFKSNERIGVLNPNSNSLGLHPKNRESINSLVSRLKEENKITFAEMPFCIGFCMVIKREVIQKVGGLSEEFYPMFFEDTDYSLKALRAGFLVGVARKAYVWHMEHASFKQMAEKKEQFFTNSRQAFIKKWGKILRIAWVVNTEYQLKDVLKNAITLARNGNYIFLLVKNLNVKPDDLFRKNNLTHHYGINFISFGNISVLFWLILTKKKRYDVIINEGGFANWLFRKFGYLVLDNFKEEQVRLIKYN